MEQFANGFGSHHMNWVYQNAVMWFGRIVSLGSGFQELQYAGADCPTRFEIFTPIS